MKTYVRYQDDGPLGACGQICEITNPWDRLHIFKTEKAANEFLRMFKKNPSVCGRRNARITGIWHDDQEIAMYSSVQRHG